MGWGQTPPLGVWVYAQYQKCFTTAAFCINRSVAFCANQSWYLYSPPKLAGAGWYHSSLFSLEVMA